MSWEAPEWLVLAPPLLLLWLLRFRRAPRSGVTRLLLLALAVLALAGPRMRLGAAGASYVLVVDRSASVQGQGLARARTLAPELERAARARGGELHVIGFGKGAALLAAPGESLGALERMPDEDDSDLATALQLAAAYARPDAPAEVVLLSDGVYTREDPRLLAAALRARGVRIHPLEVGPGRAGDTAITRLLVPERVPRGQRFALAIEAFSPRKQSARLVLRDGAGRVLADPSVELEPGARRYAIALDASATGLQLLDATLEVEGDPRTGNNRARTVLEVIGPPRVIAYAERGAGNSALVRALAAAGVEIEQRDAGTPLTLASVHGAAAVVLENVTLADLGERADEALEQYVEHLGGGLLVTGGKRSYAYGGYFRSRLEPLLPLAMDRQEELRRPRLDMAIALDRSGSMAVPARNGALKMDLANRGAAEAIGLLAPGDAVTVLAVDSAAHVIARLEKVGDAASKRALIDKVTAIEPGGGGIYVHTALAAAMDALLKGSAPTRHIVLFSDAADSEEPGDYQPLIARWVQAGGSLSVIGLGTPADVDAKLLQEIAELGGGRAYFTDDALQLPRVFAQEVMYVARKTFLEQDTPVLPARGLLALGRAPGAIPDVAGYNLTFLANGAEPVLVSGDDNAAPLAASWQRGAGKVFAVTFEADGPFTGALSGWSEYRDFFRSALEWCKRPEAKEGADARVTLAGRIATVHVELPEGAAYAATPTALVVAPDEPTARPLHMTWTSPTSLEASFEIGADGLYQSVVALPGQPPIELPPVLLPYSPELALQSGDDAGAAVLAQLAEATGGAPFLHVDTLGTARPSDARGQRSLVPWLAAALLALLLFDVAHRRGLLDGGLSRLAALAAMPLARVRGARLRLRSRSRRAEPAANPNASAPAEQTDAEAPDAPAATAAAEESPYAVAKRKAKR